MKNKYIRRPSRMKEKENLKSAKPHLLNKIYFKFKQFQHQEILGHNTLKLNMRTYWKIEVKTLEILNRGNLIRLENNQIQLCLELLLVRKNNQSHLDLKLLVRKNRPKEITQRKKNQNKAMSKKKKKTLCIMFMLWKITYKKHITYNNNLIKLWTN